MDVILTGVQGILFLIGLLVMNAGFFLVGYAIGAAMEEGDPDKTMLIVGIGSSLLVISSALISFPIAS